MSPYRHAIEGNSLPETGKARRCHAPFHVSPHVRSRTVSGFAGFVTLGGPQASADGGAARPTLAENPPQQLLSSS